MACRINVIAVFLVCATATSAVRAPFPHGKTTIYRYNTVVETTRNDENIAIPRNSSQFAMQGTFTVTHDTRDTNLVNAYNVILSNVVTDMHNGETVDYKGKPIHVPIDTAAKVIQEPFLIIYNPNGTFQAVKIDEDEPGWSKNMKMAMATMLQLDLPNINVENLADKSHNFVSQEKTIHGDCSVTYEVYPKDRVNANVPEEFSVNKTYSPMDCDGFAVHDFTNVDIEHCRDTKNPSMLTKSNREFEIEKQGEGIVIKKVNAYGVIRVLSAKGASYPHFVFTNTNFELLQVKEKSENDTLGNFVNAPIIHDVTYQKPQGNYVPNAAVDVTQGRHVVDFASLTSQLKKLLSEAVDYIHENHLSPNEMDWNQAQAINKILHTMSHMDSDTLQVTFDLFENVGFPREMRMKNIFLSVVPQVGTPASCNFTYNTILKNNISAWTAVDMLRKLPLAVKEPTTELLAQMEDLTKFDDSIPAEVRKAGIISFSSLIYRTFKHVPRPEGSTILKKYLNDFIDKVKNEATYEMKVVYLMAIRNVQVGKIYDLLEPIINGSLAISKKPENIQLLAISAIDKAVEEDYSIAHRILWPVMVNDTLSTKLRIAAYEILMNQAPNEDSALKVHQYVSQEGNANFYNYHYTTLDSIARSPDKCKMNIRTIVNSILEKTSYPRESDKKNNYPLSAVHSYGYANNMFFNAEKFDIGVIIDEFTGQPEIVQYKHVVMDKDGSVSEFAFQVHIEGHHEFMATLGPPFYYYGVTNTAIRDFLEKVARLAPATKKLHIDIVLMLNGRVFIANHYNFENLRDLFEDMMEYSYFHMRKNYTIDYQNVLFERLYEKQLTSDIGVPVVVETRAPILSSVYINYVDMSTRNSQIAPVVVAEFKTWKHGDYSMSVYNPMKDVWHSVRSHTALEVSLPIRMNVTTGQIPHSLKFSFPEAPEMVTSVAGILARARNLVTVDEEGSRALKESCPTCHHQEVVHDGTKRVDYPNEYEKWSTESKDTGLKFSSYTYNCDSGFGSEMNLGYRPHWNMYFTSNVPDRSYDLLDRTMVAARRLFKQVIFDAQQRSCGAIFKLEPSIKYPISHIDVGMVVDYTDFDHNETALSVPHAEKFSSSTTVNMTSSLTNTIVRSWILGVNVDRSRGFLANNVAVQITRKTPEENDLKICIKSKKNYPAAPADYLKLGGTNEVIDTELTFAYGYTNEDECDRNHTLASVTIKAQLSDEQNKRFKYDIENSACSEEKKNPFYANPKNLVPRTMNCLNEAIRYTTPRNYTIDIAFSEFPDDIPASIDLFMMEIRKPSESGNIKIQAEFSIETNSINLQSESNMSIYNEYIIRNKTIMNPFWDVPLDNSRFTLQFLGDMTRNNIKICSIYPQIVQTGDGENIPYTIPSDEWTLVSGDYVRKQFAIFAKQPRPNYLSFLVFMNGHGIHFFTRESDDVLVATAVSKERETEEASPLDANFSWDVKVTESNDQFVVRSKSVPLTLHVGTNYMSVVFDSKFQGHVSGLCGHLSGTSDNHKPNVHLLKDTEYHRITEYQH